MEKLADRDHETLMVFLAGVPLVPFFDGVTVITQEPRASFFEVQVTVVLMVLHVKRAVTLPFLALAAYDTPVALVNVALTIPRVALALTLFGAATIGVETMVATVDVGVSVVAAGGAVVVGAVVGAVVESVVEEGVAVFMRIFGEE